MNMRQVNQRENHPGQGTGRGDHVVRAARGRLGVVDARERSHPLAVRLLPGRQPGAPPALVGGGLGGGQAQRLGPHHYPFHTSCAQLAF